MRRAHHEGGVGVVGWGAGDLGQLGESYAAWWPEPRPVAAGLSSRPVDVGTLRVARAGTSVRLTWWATGEVSPFDVLRDVDPAFPAPAWLATTPGTAHDDLAPPPGLAYYRVGGRCP